MGGNIFGDHVGGMGKNTQHTTRIMKKRGWDELLPAANFAVGGWCSTGPPSENKRNLNVKRGGNRWMC